MKSCVVLQGPIYLHCVPSILKIIASVPNCIISTWSDENPEWIQILRDAKPLDILLNDKPATGGCAQNLNFMTHSTTTGVNRAEELGFTHVLRFRTDYSINDFAKFLEVCESLDPVKLTFMTWFPGHDYLIDYFTYGPIGLLRQYYAARREPHDIYFNHESCNEKFLQEHFFCKRPVAYSDTHEQCQLCIREAIASGVEMYIIKFDPNNRDDLFKAFYNPVLFS